MSEKRNELSILLYTRDTRGISKREDEASIRAVFLCIYRLVQLRSFSRFLSGFLVSAVVYLPWAGAATGFQKRGAREKWRFTKQKKGIYTKKKGMHKRQVEIKMRFLFVLCVCAFTGEFSCVFFSIFSQVQRMNILRRGGGCFPRKSARLLVLFRTVDHHGWRRRKLKSSF